MMMMIIKWSDGKKGKHRAKGRAGVCVGGVGQAQITAKGEDRGGLRTCTTATPHMEVALRSAWSL